MLTKSFWVACLWFSNSWVQGQLLGETNCTVDVQEVPETQTGINNFVIDMFADSMQFPFAIDQCTGNNVIGTGRWFKYHCDMDNPSGMSTVTKTQYFDEACSTDGIVVETFNETNVTEGNRGFFECSGSNTYARLRMGLDSACDGAIVIYAALGACSNFGQDSQINLYCSSNETIIQVFSFQNQLPTSTFLPSSTFLSTLFNATFPTLLNATLPTSFNATLPTSSFNATLPTLINATLPGFNVTLPGINATLPGFNATLPSMLNMSTTQMGIMLCADEAFCNKWMFIPNQCRKITTIPLALQETAIYGIMDECYTETFVSSTTMIEFSTTENVSVTEPSGGTTTTSSGSSTTTTSSGSTSTSTSTSTTVISTHSTSGAVRPSLLFTVGMFFSFFFLVTI